MDYLMLKEYIKSLESSRRDQAKKYLIEESKYLFNKYDWMFNYSFEIWTPSFNDGDPCYVSVHYYDRYLQINNINSENEEDQDKDDDEPKLWDEEFECCAAEIQVLIKNIEINDMISLFGDHCKVVINRDGTAETTYCDYGPSH